MCRGWLGVVFLDRAKLLETLKTSLSSSRVCFWSGLEKVEGEQRWKQIKHSPASLLSQNNSFNAHGPFQAFCMILYTPFRLWASPPTLTGPRKLSILSKDEQNKKRLSVVVKV